LIYKLSRKERIERRWVVMLANQKGCTDSIVWDISWFRSKSLGEFTAKMFNMEPKQRPNDVEVVLALERIRDEKGASRDDMLHMHKMKWVEKERKFIEYTQTYESFYQDFDGSTSKIDSNKLIFEYIYNITGFIRKDGTNETMFTKFGSSRRNWFTCDKMCNNEIYWINSYQNDEKWKHLVDSNKKIGIPMPQEYYHRIQSHFFDLQSFLQLITKFLDNQDPGFRDLNAWEKSVGSIARRIQENLACRKYLK
jgi:hypothetical protein